MPRRTSVAIALGLVTLTSLAACRWSTGSPDPRPPPGPRRLRARAEPPPIAVAVTAAGDEVTLRIEGRPPFAGPPTVELGPRGAAGQPLALASAPGGAYQGTRRGLPADGMLTASVFGRDTRGREVRSYLQLAVAPIDPTIDGEISSPDGALELQLAPRTLPDGVRVVIAPAPEPAPALDASTRLLAGPFAVAASDGAAPAAPVRLVFHVPSHFAVDHLDAYTIWRWDGAAWRALGGTRLDGPHGALVLLPVDTFGSYALTAKES